jgi:hypothetical protein|tara:strand:- start:464 stop:952 length:489 start_codon:yes stop_codon:yes gene_type:complete
MKEKFNIVVCGKPPRTVLEQAHDKLTRIALTLLDPKHPQAYSTCCHSHTGKSLREQPEDFNDTDEIVLLGAGGVIAHSIIKGDGDEIKSDTLCGRDDLGLELKTDGDNPHYKFTRVAGAQTYEYMSVDFRVSLKEFKEHYVDKIRSTMYAQPNTQADNDVVS